MTYCDYYILVTALNSTVNPFVRFILFSIQYVSSTIITSPLETELTEFRVNQTWYLKTHKKPSFSFELRHYWICLNPNLFLNLKNTCVSQIQQFPEKHFLNSVFNISNWRLSQWHFNKWSLTAILCYIMFVIIKYLSSYP